MTDQRGLHDKYVVTRVDGRDSPGQKHHGCRYFVLDLTHDQDAWAALHLYARLISRTHPELAADLAQMIAEDAPIITTGAAGAADLARQLEADLLLWGTAYEWRHFDGTRERIPPDQLVTHLRNLRR